MLSSELVNNIQSQLGAEINDIQPLEGGANNRVWRLNLGVKQCVLKQYYQSDGDTRPRAKSEFSFCTRLWENGEQSVPQPLHMDTSGQWALYDAVEGSSFSDVCEADVIQAAQFIGRIKHLPLAGIADASEACLKPEHYIVHVLNRIQRLNAIDKSRPLAEELLAFVNDDLAPAFTALIADTKLAPSSFLVLSPSDFGFHNALKKTNGEIKFLDFEYAGRDDPCKLVCDFFSQPRIPVSISWLALFVQYAFDEQQSIELMPRIGACLPFVRIKWCCILLNEFLHEGENRRHFSDYSAVLEQHLSQQLQKGRNMLASISELTSELRL